MTGEESGVRDAGTAGTDGNNAGTGSPSAENQTDTLTSEDVLNAAVAFAGHVATAAQQGAAQSLESEDRALHAAVLRQYLLETATLCLRRLGESYAASAAETGHTEIADLLKEGAQRSASATSAVEALSDLGLDLLDRLVA